MKTATALAFGLVLLAVVCLCNGDAMPPNTQRGGRSSQMGRGSWGQGQPGRVMGGSGKMGTLGNIQGQGRGGQGQWQSGQGQGQWQQGQQSGQQGQWQQGGQQGRGIGGIGGSQGGMMGGRGIGGSQGNWQQGQGQGKILG